MMEVLKCPNCDEPLSKVIESGSDVFLEWDETKNCYREGIQSQDAYRYFCGRCYSEVDNNFYEPLPLK